MLNDASSPTQNTVIILVIVLYLWCKHDFIHEHRLTTLLARADMNVKLSHFLVRVILGR